MSRRIPPCLFAAAMFGSLSTSLAAGETDEAALARKAQEILRASCYKCHGQDGRNEGGFNTVIDLKKLTDSKRVVPGDPVKSRLFRRMTSTDNPMPPEADDSETSARPKP